MNSIEDKADNIKLSDFLTLAPVLLRAQSRRVVSELVVTAAADLIPGITFSALLSIDDISNVKGLLAHRNEHLLQSHEAKELYTQLPKWLLAFSDQPIIIEFDQIDRNLRNLLNCSVLYKIPVRTPTRHFGYLLGGSHKQLNSVNHQYLQLLANLAAIAIDNAIRFEDLKEAATEMSLVNEMAGSLAASLNGEELFNSFVTRLRDIIPLDRISLAVLNPLSKHYSVPFSWNEPPGCSRRSFIKDLPLAGSPFEQALGKQEIVVNNWETHVDDQQEEEVNIFDARYASQMIIPLIAKRQMVGALAIGTTEVDAYSEDELRRSLLEKLAALFALALLNSRLYEEKQLSAEFDSRIGVYNHDYFDRDLTTQLHKARRNNYKLGLMMVDMDNLKVVNDKHGHLAGDAALRHIATIISSTVRATDVVARYGGDEFGVMLPGCTPFGLEVVAEKARQAISSTPLVLEDGTQIKLSVSLGAVIYPEDAQTPRELIAQADAAMYVAKKYRNQVRIGLAARIPRVGEHELNYADHPDLMLENAASTDLKTEDYRRLLDWLSDNGSNVENRVIHELSQRLDDMQHDLKETTTRLALTQEGLQRTLRLTAEVIERREPYLSGGAVKLTQLVRVIATKLNLSETEIKDLETASWLCNISRMLIPESTWTFPGRLSAYDWRRIRQSPQEANAMLATLAGALPANALQAVYHLHERYDGTGYPLRLAGEEIPLSARLLSIAFALIAMTQPRPYRLGCNLAACQRQIRQGAGRQFDTYLADVVLSMLSDGALDFLEFAK